MNITTFTNLAAWGIPLEQLGFVVPTAIVVFVSLWGSVRSAAPWEMAIIFSIVVALAYHKHLSSRRATDLNVAWKAPRTNTGSQRSAGQAEGRKRRLIRVLWQRLKIDASAYADPWELVKRNPADITKLYAWLESIEANPRIADRDDDVLFSVLWEHSKYRGDIFCLERILECIVQCGLHADVAMYTQVISGLGNRGKVERAEVWFSRMEEAGVEGDVRLFSSIINGWAQVGNPVMAAKWYVKMLKIGLAPTEVTFNSLIDACAKGGAPKEGEEWMYAMEAAGIAPSVCTFNALINGFSRVGETERAEYWLMEIARRGMTPDVASYSTILHALTCQKNPTRVMQADRVLRRMIACGLTGSRPMFRNHKAVIMICARGKEVDLALYWLKAAEEAGIKTGRYSYKFVANALEIAGREQEAAAMREKLNTRCYGPVGQWPEKITEGHGTPSPQDSA